MAAVVSSPMDGGANVGSSAAGTFGPGSSWNGLSILGSQRYKDLSAKESYFKCTQHDSKRFDFEGRVISSGGGINATQPLIGTEKASFYVPLRLRRPSSPYRLPKVIVKSFTNLIFGESRFPNFRVNGDSTSQDFANALAHATRLPMKMIRIRNIGGSVGSAAMSWAYVDGYPRINVHNAKNCFIHSWEDREELIVRHATEAYLSPKLEWVQERKAFENVYYWHRRDWTTSEDIVFKPLKFERNVDPSPRWEPDLAQSFTHDDGICHFHWVQNLPTDEMDGETDYEGLYENFDTLDLLLSVILRGATLNLDPTLKLKMDPDLLSRRSVNKGSDHALIVGIDGDAEYLEITGQGIEAGVNLFNKKRSALLEVAECVIPDPDKVSAQGLSSVAQKMLFAPMIGKGAQLREQYGTAMGRMLEDMIVIARSAKKSTIVVYDKDTGEPFEAEQKIILPPRTEQEAVVDEHGNPTGDFKQNQIERDPGEGEEVDPEWGQWFPPTPDDQSKTVTTLTAAAGGPGVAIMSKQTAAELTATAFNRDPGEEWSKMQKETSDAQAQQAQMFDGDVGGKVEHTEKTHGGGSVTATLEHKPKSQQPPPPQGLPGQPGAAPGGKGAPGAAGGGGAGGGAAGGGKGVMGDGDIDESGEASESPPANPFSKK